MTDAARAGLRQALATALAALVVGSFHTPQAFLAVLLVQLLGGIPCTSGIELVRRFFFAAAGAFGGLAILTLAPNEQWISLPLFFTACGWGTLAVLGRHGPACGILFGVGLVAMFAESFVFPARDLIFGFTHFFSLLVATLATALTGRVFQRQTPMESAVRPPPGEPTIIAAAATGGLITACAIFPAQLNVTTVSAFATAFALSRGGGSVGKKFSGGLLGILVALVFLIPVIGAGNDLAVYLLGLSVILGLFEWLACGFPSQAAVFRQGAAMFAVAATILPQPDRLITASMERMCAATLGLLIGAACFLLHEAFANARASAGSVG